MTNLPTLLIFFAAWGLLYAAARNLAQRDRLPPLMPEVMAAGGLLAVGTAGFFWRVLLTPSWMPAGGGDLAPFLYPNYHFAASQLKQGVIPLWNPHLYSGVPFAADIQNGLFYPINLILFFASPEVTFESLQFLAIFHFWLAGIGMYLCLRIAGQLHPLAAFAGALAFEFSDLFIVHFGNLNMIAVAAWLPLIFLTFHQAVQRRSTSLAALAGVFLAVSTLAGHIQITLFMLLVLGLYVVWQVVASMTTRRAGALLPAAQPALYFLLSLTVTVGLSAPLLLPAYEMSLYTPRAGLSYVEAAQYSLNPAQLAGLLIPNFFGRDPALHWGPWDRVETGYIGIFPLFLALVGILTRRDRLGRFFLGLGLVAFLLALGGESALHGWLYALVPGFNQLRAPARFILLLDFALAALAAFGLEALLAPAEPGRSLPGSILRPLTWIVGGLIVVSLPLSYFALLITQDRNPVIFQRAAAAAQGVVVFALLAGASLLILHLANAGRLRGLGLGLGAIALIAIDLFSLGSNVDVGQRDPAASYRHPEAVAFLQSDPGYHRLEVTTDVWHLWQPDAALFYGLYDAWGLYNPLTLSDTTRYWQFVGERKGERYNFLGIKYIIAGKAGAPADGNPGAIVPVFDRDPGINIYLNQSALPRVLFVGRAIASPDHESAWQAVTAPNFDPATTVVLEGLAAPGPESQPKARLAILEYGLHRVQVSVRADAPGYLVLSDAYYPGWQATIDGSPTAIYRANYAFRAVRVPAGDHVVRFEFRPRLWQAGLVVSGLTILGLAVLGGFKVAVALRN
ncbi:MAG: YfhO family protein [Anaerolineae bacterium]